MQRIISEQEEVVKLRIEEKRILVKAGISTLCSQLLEGQYPNYEAIIPTDLDRKISIDKRELESAIRRVSIMTTEEYKLLRFKFTDNTLVMQCISPDVGESKTVIPIEYTGDEIEIGLNPEFLLDFLKNVNSEKVRLELKNPGTAAVFREEGGCLYAVAPMNLGDKQEENYE